jgi:predicted transcriptional regulator
MGRPALSRREQQILDIIYASGHATAADVRAAMPDAPTDAAVRTTLRILVEKGHLRIEPDGPRYTYWPTVGRRTAQRTALRHMLTTFFGGSAASALAALLEIDNAGLSEAERRRVKQAIERASKEGR